MALQAPSPRRAILVANGADIAGLRRELALSLMTRRRHWVVARQSIRVFVVAVDAGARNNGAVLAQSLEQGLLTHVYET